MTREAKKSSSSVREVKDRLSSCQTVESPEHKHSLVDQHILCTLQPVAKIMIAEIQIAGLKKRTLVWCVRKN